MVYKDKIEKFLTMYKASNSDGIIRNDTEDAATISDAWLDFHLHPYLLGGSLCEFLPKHRTFQNQR